MTNNEFSKIVKEQLGSIEKLLVVKGAEYNLDDSDRFSDFKQAAAFTGQTPEQVLYGYMLKHVMSITSMIQSAEPFTKERWLEKITDNMVYLVLLRGLLEDTPRMLVNEAKSAKCTCNSEAGCTCESGTCNCEVHE